MKPIHLLAGMFGVFVILLDLVVLTGFESGYDTPLMLFVGLALGQLALLACWCGSPSRAWLAQSGGDTDRSCRTKPTVRQAYTKQLGTVVHALLSFRGWHGRRSTAGKPVGHPPRALGSKTSNRDNSPDTVHPILAWQFTVRHDFDRHRFGSRSPFCDPR